MPWIEVYDVVAAGCAAGRRERYLRAYEEMQAWRRVIDRATELSSADRHQRIEWRDKISADLRESAQAIIDAGVELQTPQEPLFELGTL